MRKSRNIDMKEVLTYSLRKFPSPIATVDGKLVKTPKSKLMHVLESLVEDPTIESIPSNNALILDGMALPGDETFPTPSESWLRSYW